MLSQLLFVRCEVNVLDEHTSLIAVVFLLLAASLAHIVSRGLLLLLLLVVLICTKLVRTS